MGNQLYDVVVIGGGVAGAALLYALAAFTDLKRVALIEKYSQVASVNSSATNNSQTIHCGDIETNYSLEKALKVRRSAQMLVRYASQLPPAQRDQIIYPFPKMVLGVGTQECEFLRQRYETFQPHFTGMRLLEKSQIAAIEPNVVKINGQDRPEDLVAIAIADEYTAIHYGTLARSFVAQAQAVSGKTIDLRLGNPVQAIEPVGPHYRITTAEGSMMARFVVHAASPQRQSLYRAKRQTPLCCNSRRSGYYSPWQNSLWPDSAAAALARTGESEHADRLFRSAEARPARGECVVGSV
jgi:malate dehydrogenase (quinone)